MPVTPDGSARVWPTATTRGLAVLGWPVHHSLSPVMHNAALRAGGHDLVYLALPTPPEQLYAVVGALGAVGFVGANVTVPHKRAVMDVCDSLTEEARLVGAVNTLSWGGDELLGHNTDAIGLQRALDEAGAGLGPAVLLGTGGAARAAAVALARRGNAVTVVGRRPDAAAEVADVARAAGGEAAHEDLTDPAVAARVAEAAVVCNATPLGMGREELPAPFMTLHADQTAYDLVYAPPDTPFVTAARRVGANAHHGLSMLVHQAAAALERWIDAPVPVELMRGAAEDALWA